MPETFSFPYRSLSVSYRKLGSGRPLIILHGWGTSGKAMMPLAESLSSIRTCYVLDLPGFGNSSDPDFAWSVDDYADLVEAFVKSIEAEKIDMLVHSFGARITIKLCSRETGKRLIDKVLITGGAGMKPRRSLSFYFKKYLVKLLKAPFYLLPEGVREKKLEKLKSSSLWKSLGSSDYQQLSGVMRDTFVKSVTEHLDACLPNVSQEVLLLWGRNDEATPIYQARKMEEGIEHAVLIIIEHAAHYAFLDRPKHFASIAHAFFEGTST